MEPSDSSHPYYKKNISFCTMHQKETILAPLFKRFFRAFFLVPENLDTDIFGTFSGEVKRDENLKKVLRRKVSLGLQKTGLSLGIASEGSFGPHPSVPFMNTNLETLIFVDVDRKVEIFESHLSLKTSMRSQKARSLDELIEFYEICEEKEQAILIKANQLSVQPKWIRKGIKTKKAAIKAFEELKLKSNSKTLWLETDMRAHLSKLRREAIFIVGEKLVHRLQSLCPSCECPGFSRKDLIEGLPCSECGIPSKYALKEIWRCSSEKQLCSYQEIRPRSDGMSSIDPGDCLFCNP